MSITTTELTPYDMHFVLSRCPKDIRKLLSDNPSTHDGEDTEQWTARVVTGLLREVDPLVVVDGMDFIDEHGVTTNEGGA